MRRNVLINIVKQCFDRSNFPLDRFRFVFLVQVAYVFFQHIWRDIRDFQIGKMIVKLFKVNAICFNGFGIQTLTEKSSENISMGECVGKF